jgi:hypothetical protein
VLSVTHLHGPALYHKAAFGRNRESLSSKSFFSNSLSGSSWCKTALLRQVEGPAGRVPSPRTTKSTKDAKGNPGRYGANASPRKFPRSPRFVSFPRRRGPTSPLVSPTRALGADLDPAPPGPRFRPGSRSLIASRMLFATCSGRGGRHCCRVKGVGGSARMPIFRGVEPSRLSHDIMEPWRGLNHRGA